MGEGGGEIDLGPFPRLLAVGTDKAQFAALGGQVDRFRGVE